MPTILLGLDVRIVRLFPASKEQRWLYPASWSESIRLELTSARCGMEKSIESNDSFESVWELRSKFQRNVLRRECTVAPLLHVLNFHFGRRPVVTTRPETPQTKHYIVI